jgi:hypothetical protein
MPRSVRSITTIMGQEEYRSDLNPLLPSFFPFLFFFLIMGRYMKRKPPSIASTGRNDMWITKSEMLTENIEAATITPV